MKREYSLTSRLILNGKALLCVWLISFMKPACLSLSTPHLLLLMEGTRENVQ